MVEQTAEAAIPTDPAQADVVFLPQYGDNAFERGDPLRFLLENRHESARQAVYRFVKVDLPRVQDVRALKSIIKAAMEFNRAEWEPLVFWFLHMKRPRQFRNGATQSETLKFQRDWIADESDALNFVIGCALANEDARSYIFGILSGMIADKLLRMPYLYWSTRAMQYMVEAHGSGKKVYCSAEGEEWALGDKWLDVFAKVEDITLIDTLKRRREKIGEQLKKMDGGQRYQFRQRKNRIDAVITTLVEARRRQFPNISKTFGAYLRAKGSLRSRVEIAVQHSHEERWRDLQGETLPITVTIKVPDENEVPVLASILRKCDVQVEDQGTMKLADWDSGAARYTFPLQVHPGKNRFAIRFTGKNGYLQEHLTEAYGYVFVQF
jgi:hypothetical protein